MTKGVNLIRKINLLLLRSSLLTKYKSFFRTRNLKQSFETWNFKFRSLVRPHLGYGDVIYDQSNNSRLSDKIETTQYNSVLAITGIKPLSASVAII